VGKSGEKMSSRSKTSRSKIAPPARRIRSAITQVIWGIGKELLIPTWGKIPHKMYVASMAITMTNWCLKEYLERVGKGIDIDELINFVKVLAEINGVTTIDYNYSDVYEFFINNVRLKKDDTYMTFLKRVGVICIAILLKIFVTPTYVPSIADILGELEETLYE
jgi:hypothetical protein